MRPCTHRIKQRKLNPCLYITDVNYLSWKIQMNSTTLITLVTNFPIPVRLTNANNSWKLFFMECIFIDKPGFSNNDNLKIITTVWVGTKEWRTINNNSRQENEVHCQHHIDILLTWSCSMVDVELMEPLLLSWDLDRLTGYFLVFSLQWTCLYFICPVRFWISACLRIFGWRGVVGDWFVHIEWGEDTGHHNVFLSLAFSLERVTIF